jgi:hypothetical protein
MSCNTPSNSTQTHIKGCAYDDVSNMCGDASCSQSSLSFDPTRLPLGNSVLFRKREGREAPSRVRLPSVVSDIDARVESVSKAVNLPG